MSTRTNRDNGNICAIVGLIPIGFAVALRGDVGGDTANYISIVESLVNRDYFDIFIEPVFLLYSRLLLALDFEPRIIINLLGVINLGLLYYAAQKIEKGKVILSLIIVPIFFVDFLMNGMRIGLAVAFIMLAYYQLANERLFKFAAFSLVAIMTHLSIIYIFVLMLGEMNKKIRARVIIIFTLAIGIILKTSDQVSLYLLGKSEDYLNSDAESILGIVPFTLNILMIAMLFFISKKRKPIKKLNYTCFVLLILSVGFYLLIPVFPWFAARFMWLNLLYLSILVAASIARSKLTLSSIELFGLAIIGLLGFASHIRQFFMAEGVGLSPFLPYKLFL